VAFSPRIGLGALWRHLGTGKEEEDLFQAAIAEELKQREEQESSRLLYVAMTRAEEHLILSFSAVGKRRDNWVKLVAPKLGIDLERAVEETRSLAAPDEKQWNLQIRVADKPPEAMPRPVLEEAVSLVERIAPPAAHNQQDTNATVTAVAAFAKCPREYYLGHYLGYEGRTRGVAESGELAAADFGTQVHALLAGTPVENADPEAERLAEVFRQSALGRRAAQAGHVEREFDFLMSVDDLVLRGQVDLWFEEDGALTIVDYKTDTVTAQEAHQRAPDYAMQLRLYAMAVERLTGRSPKHAWLHFLRPNTAIEVDLNAPLWEAPEEVVRKFQEAQSRLEFPLLEAAHCRRCPFFRDLCPSAYGA
jgi:ATP-dependent exoDNAse (exonuclease V) beta subunit